MPFYNLNVENFENFHLIYDFKKEFLQNISKNTCFCPLLNFHFGTPWYLSLGALAIKLIATGGHQIDFALILSVTFLHFVTAEWLL